MANERLEINVAFASTPLSLQEIFAAVLGFPGYYGMNWNAFWDCIGGPEQSKMPGELVIKGMGRLTEIMPEQAQVLRELVNELKDKRPEIKVTLIDEE